MKRVPVSGLLIIYRLAAILLLVAICGVGQSRRSSAQATPTAADICAPYLDDATPVAGGGNPAIVDVATLEFDVLFLDGMVPHHESAVQMAQIARDRVEQPELIEFAGTIVATQQAEIETMRDWRQSWYPSVPPLTEQELID